MIKDTFYCAKKNEKFIHFYKNKLGIKMCGYGLDEILQVSVREISENEEPTHYGWYDFEKNNLSLVFNTKTQLRMCFPYGMSIEEKEGKGKCVELIVYQD